MYLMENKLNLVILSMILMENNICPSNKYILMYAFKLFTFVFVLTVRIYKC